MLEKVCFALSYDLPPPPPPPHPHSPFLISISSSFNITSKSLDAVLVQFLPICAMCNICIREVIPGFHVEDLYAQILRAPGKRHICHHVYDSALPTFDFGHIHF